MFIPDSTFFHPGSQILIQEFKYLTEKKSLGKMFILDPDFLLIPDPGSRGQKGTGFRIHNTDAKRRLSFT
jgi:hypothetical protein